VAESAQESVIIADIRSPAQTGPNHTEFPVFRIEDEERCLFDAPEGRKAGDDGENCPTFDCRLITNSAIPMFVKEA